MLVNEPKFPAVQRMLNNWIKEKLQNVSCGVLVSHNTATDIQFMSCEYIRCGAKLPAPVTLGLDTLKTVQRFTTICYRKVPANEWTVITKKGKTSMGMKPCAVYALSKRNPPQTFEEVCGEHHDAEADVKGVSVMLFDETQFGAASLYHTVFKNPRRRCFQPLEEIWSAMEIKMQEPVLDIEPVPPGWIPAQVILFPPPSTSQHHNLTLSSTIIVGVAR